MMIFDDSMRDVTGRSLNLLRKHTFEVELLGKKALFTTPESRTIGNKRSYRVPPLEAIREMIKSVYWKPGLMVVVDEIRVMNCMDTALNNDETTRGSVGLDYKLNQPIMITEYLRDPWYKVRFHLDWDPKNLHIREEINTPKQIDMMNRYFIKGARMPCYFGTSECVADVGPTKFDEGIGYYDGSGEIELSYMYLCKIYPEMTENPVWNHQRRLAFWSPVMVDGVIKYPRMEDIPEKDTFVLLENQSAYQAVDKLNHNLPV